MVASFMQPKVSRQKTSFFLEKSTIAVGRCKSKIGHQHPSSSGSTLHLGKKTDNSPDMQTTSGVPFMIKNKT